MSRRRVVSIKWIEALGKWPQMERLEEERLNEPDAPLSSPLSLDEVSELELSSERFANNPSGRRLRLEMAVRSALGKLSDDEREVVERFLLAGQPMTELAELTGRRVHRLTTMYARACRKLEKFLRATVQKEFGIDEKSTGQSKRADSSLVCPVCNSGNRDAIDQIIANRPQRTTWRLIIERLRSEYVIVITTPQILIGHQRYH